MEGTACDEGFYVPFKTSSRSKRDNYFLLPTAESQVPVLKRIFLDSRYHKKTPGPHPRILRDHVRASRLMIDIVADLLTRNLGGWSEAKKAGTSFFFVVVAFACRYITRDVD